MIIDHNHPLYKAKWNTLGGGNKYNGAYYYSKEIVKNIIPNVKTDRNWITIRLSDMKVHPDHSIIFIHNNRNPNYYSYLKDYKDCVLVCGLKSTAENMRFYSDKVIYLPISIDVEQVKKYRVKTKTKDVAYAGRKIKLEYVNNIVPKNTPVLSEMPQSQLLKEMAKYKRLYCSGRTALQAKVLGCEVLPHETNFPDPSIWVVLDNKDAAVILQEKLDILDGKFMER